MRAVDALSLLVLLAPILQAGDGRQAPHARQSRDNWPALRAGQKVRVKTNGTGNRKGTFLVFTTDSISIHTKNRDPEIQRTEVKTVKIKSAAARLRHTPIGAGLGAAAGAAMASPNINGGEAAHAAIGAAGITMVGATVVGAVLPANSTVY